MQGKIVLITGSNSGIGKETALGLAKKGATIVLACRNRQKATAVKQEIINQSGNPDIHTLELDLASLASVRQCSEAFKMQFKFLHVLINNAGVYHAKQKLTQDGIEAQFGVNHLGHFLLTLLLEDHLRKSAPARVIMVSSILHKLPLANINFSSFKNHSSYSGFKAYAQSKLANAVFAIELAKRWQETGITVNFLHPGGVRTHINQELSVLMQKIMNPFLISPQKGAATSIYLASSPEVAGISGKFFANAKLQKTAVKVLDQQLRNRLWDESQSLCQQFL